ncbi:uncharacterized protein LOC118507106 [Anopheles stephensi]|uniref:uncharacterized protein LOC118507106 n=1 Tax=Anopheles stephensi TaxID=30069 RepID=UPI0016587931|nr:uncharacterized protein LOC118507106 [Anopheles stephensi]
MFADITILAAVVALAYEECTVYIRTQLNAKKPLFLCDNQFWAPDGSSLRWTGTVTANIQCVSGQPINLGGANVNFADVACATNTTGSVRNTPKSRGIGGTPVNIGFHVPSVPCVTYIQSCYNIRTTSVIYTHHVIRGAAIEHKIIDRATHSFKLAGFNRDIREAYLQENQKTRILELLGLYQLVETNKQTSTSPEDISHGMRTVSPGPSSEHTNSSSTQSPNGSR